MKTISTIGIVAFSSAVLGLLTPTIFQQKGSSLVQMWEYKVVRYDAAGGSYSRIGRQYSSVGSEATGVPISEFQLDTIGASGWELVSSHLEMETAFPNFARGDTVEGLKSNVRPQAVVLLFKRRTSTDQFLRKLEIEKEARDYLAQVEAKRNAQERQLAEKKKAEADKAEAEKKKRDSLDEAARKKLDEENEKIRQQKAVEEKKAAMALWEKHKADAILDGIAVNGAEDGLKIIAVGPESRFTVGGIIMGIQTSASSEMISVTTWSQLKGLLVGQGGKTVRIAWKDGESSYEYNVVVKYPIK